MYTRIFCIFFSRLDRRCVFRGSSPAIRAFGWGAGEASCLSFLHTVLPNHYRISGTFSFLFSCGASSLSDFLDRAYIFFFSTVYEVLSNSAFFLGSVFFLLFPGRRFSSTLATYLLPARAHCFGGVCLGALGVYIYIVLERNGSRNRASNVLYVRV